MSIALTSGFPVIFRQKRTGKDGKTFTMYKFRTMMPNAEAQKTKYVHLNVAGAPAFKIPDDPRYTPIGRFLSHTGLDELPQLFNVLKGEMSLIGPRPLPVSEAAKLKSWQKEREKIRPGIISPWILNGYHKNTFDDWMTSDIEYTRNKSLKTDINIGVKTIRFLFGLLINEII
jgi:lipopolysaccharide/colanic/teichoic acid biosynthesis glycosyltransferase